MLKTANKPNNGKHERKPPRTRVLDAAAELFYRHGIKAVGVDSIAEAAGTNKMTLYRHFPSKDDLVAAYLTRLSEEAKAGARRLDIAHAGEPRRRLRAWLGEVAAHLANKNDRGCALANAAVELPNDEHPARRVIETFKTAQRARLVELCEAAGLAEPDMLANELFLMIEGARVTAQTIGRAGLAERLVAMGDALIAAHEI
jgi:AcrR family transcriptional regulator